MSLFLELITINLAKEGASIMMNKFLDSHDPSVWYVRGYKDAEKGNGKFK